MAGIKCYLPEYLRVSQDSRTRRVWVGWGRGKSEYFISDSIRNHCYMVKVKSRLTFSQFYFVFVCKFLTDNASLSGLHLEHTV